LAPDTDSGHADEAAGPAGPLSLAQFLRDLQRLGSLHPAQIAELSSFADSSALAPGDAQVRDFARSLVDRGLLTEFQAETILTGRVAELRLANYVIVGKLGQGGMGIVYDAFDTERRTPVALKVLPRVDPGSLYRFKREFRAHADLSHPNLIKLYELFSHDGRWFFTMEKVEGADFLAALGAAPVWNPTRESALPPRGGSAGTIAATPVSSVLALHALEQGAPASKAGVPIEDHRLRVALRQLVEGLLAVHDAGLLHRDIKPSNVLVRPDGLVVILDFGLVTDVVTAPDDPGTPASPDGHASAPPGLSDFAVVGTIDYMSPEQAAGQPLGPASDWYSVGVMLYQALTGSKPFVGNPWQILTDKQRFDPPAPRAMAPDIAEDLDLLCGALLSRQPENRPGGREILDRLDRSALGGRRERSSTAQSSPALSFVGRAAQLKQLASGYESVRAGRATVVFLSGPSGVGKSSLVEHFLGTLREAEMPLVLCGRCFEQESVPFKALDSLIDALARHLRRSGPDLAAMLPDSISALAQIFPTLRRVTEIAACAAAEREILDPQERRRRAFEAFRALLSRIARQRPLVLAIDDVQWGDIDSAQLLTQLLLPPDPPRLLLLAVSRCEHAEDSECLRLLREGISPARDDLARLDIDVEPLTPQEARALARAVLKTEGHAAPERIDSIVKDSHGNPYLIWELARHNLAGAQEATPAAQAAGADLNTVLGARIDRLPEAARQLLEVIAVASRPISQRSAYQAAGLEGDAWSALMALRSGKFARSHGLRLDDEVVAFHDRIREVVTDRLSPPRRLEVHHRLALALEQSAATSEETLASHFLGAELFDRAGMYYERAADRAASSLAFDKAAKLYDLAQAIRPLSGADLRPFQIKRANALACSGRGYEAARIYLELAEPGAPSEAFELRKRAAYQFCITGRIDEGRAIWQTVLAEHGLALPRSPRWALVHLLREMLLLKAAGYRFHDRAGAALTPDLRQRLDLLWAAGVGLGMFDVLPSHIFQLKGLRESLRAGDPYRSARTLASVATILAYQGTSQIDKVDHLLAQSDELARKCGEPHALGIQALMGAFADLHLDRLVQGQKRISVAQEIFARDCQDAFWELDTANLVALWLHVFLGNCEQAEHDWAIQRLAAQERGDLYAQFTLEVIIGSFLRLNRDEPEEAREAIRSVMAHWKGGEFQIQHLSALEAESRIDRYQGGGGEAFEKLMAQWPIIARSLLFRSQLTRTSFLAARAHAAIQASPGSPDSSRLLALARRDARSLYRERWARATALAATIEGSVDALEGARASAVSHFRQAAAIFDASHTPLPAASVRFRLATLLDGDEGESLREEAMGMFRSMRVKDPIRSVQMITGSTAQRS
jgi:serine/threonine protein kinase